MHRYYHPLHFCFSSLCSQSNSTTHNCIMKEVSIFIYLFIHSPSPQKKFSKFFTKKLKKVEKKLLKVFKKILKNVENFFGDIICPCYEETPSMSLHHEWLISVWFHVLPFIQFFKILWVNNNLFCVSNNNLVLWKRLNTETSQHGNASKTGFEEFPFFFGKSLKTGKCWGISEYFWGVS